MFLGLIATKYNKTEDNLWFPKVSSVTGPTRSRPVDPDWPGNGQHLTLPVLTTIFIFILALPLLKAPDRV